MVSLAESLTYSPVELAFGTSGLRGLVTDMTDLECYINTAGFIAFLERSQQIQAGATIYLAGDLRDSTPRITAAVNTAIQDKGYVVNYGGSVPTPTIANFALMNGAACIMVTGSHIPADRNGIKFYKVGEEVLKADEPAIKEAVASERARINGEDVAVSKFDTEGWLKESLPLPAINEEVETRYKSRFTDFFENKAFAGKKVVVYQHSAVGRDLMVEYLEALGATTVAVGRSDVFIPIDNENVTPDDQAYFKKVASENPDAFAIISTDGDSDRPFMIDEKGVFHRGDEMGALVASWIGPDFAAVSVSANNSVDEFMKEKNIELTHAKIGSPYIISLMDEAMKAGKQKAVGWEVNGGFLLGTDITIEGRTMTRLPTRDAFFPMFVTLLSAIQASTSISELFKTLPARFTQAGLIDEFPVETSRKIVGQVAEDTPENRRFLREFFTDEQGFSEIIGINTLDGIRIYFENSDIAHLRPSGNAPQMRIYSVADSQARADEIVRLGLDENGGILRSIEAKVMNAE